MVRVKSPSLYISPYASLDVELRTCYRFAPSIQQDMELESDFEITGKFISKR